VGTDVEARPSKQPALEVSEVADGLVVYQADPERVHYLNHTAAIVFELCTGDNTETEIVDLIAGAFSLDAPPSREVAACLAHLRHEGIVA
jgi:hypothetical protein